MVDKYTAYGAVTGSGATLLTGNVGLVGSLAIGGGAWVLSDNKKYKEAGKGAVIGAGVTVVAEIILALMLIRISTDPNQIANAKAVLERYGVKQ